MQSASEVCKRYRENNKNKFYEAQKERRNNLSGRLGMIFQSAKDRAQRKKIKFDLSIDDLHALWIKQDGKCAITNLQMELNSHKREKANSFIVSLDRIVPELGYTNSNIQLICLAVNRMKWNYDPEQFEFWIRIISREAFSNEGTFNDYLERE